MMSALAKFGLAGVLVSLAACGGEDMPAPSNQNQTDVPRQPPRMKQLVTVEFEYRSSTEIPDSVWMDRRACATLVGRTHIHAS